MDDANPPRRPFRLADLFLLTIGFALGFAMFSVIRAAEIRRELESPVSVSSHSLYHAGTIELLATALSIGIAAAFPLVRLREAWTCPAHRRLRVTDVLGAPPLLFWVPVFALSNGLFPDPGWLEMIAVIALLFLGTTMLAWIPVTLWFLSAIPTPHNWIEYLALASTPTSALVLLRAFS